MVRDFGVVCALLAAALFAGCSRNEYVVELKPTGDVIERRLTGWHLQGSGERDDQIGQLGADELARLARLYEKRASGLNEKKQTFVGRFREKLPQDIGGDGTYTFWDTPLGSMAAYVERFRGNDDLLAKQDRHHKIIDDAVDLLIGWLEAELGKQAEFDKLRTFVDRNLRRDLKNLASYATHAGSAARDSTAIEEWAVRMMQYCCERGYVTPREIPRLMRSWQEDLPLVLLSRIVTTNMKVDGERPAFLADEPTAQASLRRYLSTTPQYRRLVTEWVAKGRPDANTPKPDDVLEMVLEPVNDEIGWFRRHDKLDLRLSCSTEPVHTNGKWDAGKKQVVWQSEISPPLLPPTLCYATWSEPNQKFQHEHFGKVALTGKALQSYAMWYHGLTAKESAQWDAFVEKLTPGPDLKKVLGQFQFSGKKNDGGAGKGLIAAGL
ncbi:MAG: hypothetical protein WD468_03695 [Pirellulales bacterium]